MEVSGKALVVKDNRMIEASYTLDLVEQRIILMAIAWVREHGVTLTRDTWVEVRAQDYAEIYGVDTTIAYRQLKAACESLLDRRIRIKGVNPATRATAVYNSHWVNSAVYVETVGFVHLRFDETLIPYMSDVRTQFTSYNLDSVQKLSSTYAIRLYELLSQYKKIGKRKISIGDLKDFLECDSPAYERIDNFKKKVIDFSVAQINSSTDMECSYTTEKAGTRVVAFDFLIKPKRKARIKKEKDELIPVLSKKLSPQELARQAIEDAVKAAEAKKQK